MRAPAWLMLGVFLAAFAMFVAQQTFLSSATRDPDPGALLNVADGITAVTAFLAFTHAVLFTLLGLSWGNRPYEVGVRITAGLFAAFTLFVLWPLLDMAQFVFGHFAGPVAKSIAAIDCGLAGILLVGDLAIAVRPALAIGELA
jgi:hypothetical protein